MNKILIFLANQEMIELAAIHFRKLNVQDEFNLKMYSSDEKNNYHDYDLIVVTDYLDQTIHSRMAHGYFGFNKLLDVIESGYNKSLILSIVGLDCLQGYVRLDEVLEKSCVLRSLNSSLIKDIRSDKTYIVNDFNFFKNFPGFINFVNSLLI